MAKKIKQTYGAPARKEMERMEREASRPQKISRPMKKGARGR